MCMYLCYVCCLHVMLNLSMLEFHGNSCIQGMQLHDIYRVLTCNLFIYSFVFFNIHSLCLHTSPGMCSSSAQKYFRRATRLNWPEGAVSRESIRAVRKLDRLKDLVSRSADHSRAVLVDLLYGLLRFEPSERLSAQEALDHPFFRNPT